MLKARRSALAPRPALTDADAPAGRHESGIYPTSIDPAAVVQVLSEADTGVWSFATGATHVLASPPARRILGMAESAELRAEGWIDRVHPADRERIGAEVARLSREEGPFAFELRVTDEGGGSTWVEVHGRSHIEGGRFVRAGGTVRSSRRPTLPTLDERGPACVRRPANLGMIAAAVIDELQAQHPARTIHLALSGHLDGEWDPERIAQTLGDLVVESLEGGADWPVIVRVSGRGAQVQVVVEGSAAGGGARVPAARQVVRAHGGSLLEQPSDDPGTRFLLVLPRRAN
jgi:hypothetical protein